MLKLLAFKWLLNELLLEREWSEVMLIWWLLLEREWSEVMLIWWLLLETEWSEIMLIWWLLLETEWSEVMLIWWLLLETEWSEVMLIWWFVSIKFLRSFSKFPFLISLFKRFPLPLFHLQYHYGSIVLFFSYFFRQKDIIFFFCSFF